MNRPFNKQQNRFNQGKNDFQKKPRDDFGRQGNGGPYSPNLANIDPDYDTYYRPNNRPNNPQLNNGPNYDEYDIDTHNANAKAEEYNGRQGNPYRNDFDPNDMEALRNWEPEQSKI